jgi:hypothetical protein
MLHNCRYTNVNPRPNYYGDENNDHDLEIIHTTTRKNKIQKTLPTKKPHTKRFSLRRSRNDYRPNFKCSVTYESLNNVRPTDYIEEYDQDDDGEDFNDEQFSDFETASEDFGLQESYQDIESISESYENTRILDKLINKGKGGKHKKSENWYD